MPSTPIKRPSKMGRPTKYTPALLQQVRDYLGVDADLRRTERTPGYVTRGDMIPSVAGLVTLIGVRSETVHDWRTKHEHFSALLDYMKREQERVLLSGGLSGALNSNIAKLVLNKHDYSDRVQSDHTSSDGSMTPQRIERVVVTVSENAKNTDR